MKLYHTDKAPNPHRVVFFLRAKGKLDAVELKDVSIMKGEHKSPEYRALSPWAQVPVLELDDGTCITESRAICTYFEAMFPEPNLMGNDAKEKALIEMWDRRIELMLFVPFATWFRNTHEMMAPLENPQLPEAGLKGEKVAKSFVKRLDAHMADKKFIAADRFSIADITAYIALGFARVMQWDPAKENENLARWHGEMKARGFDS